MRETFFFSYIFLLHHLVIIIIIVVVVVVVKRSTTKIFSKSKKTNQFSRHIFSPREYNSIIEDVVVRC